MKTIKQVADALKVTKTTINNNAKALELEFEKIDNTYYINEYQEKLLSDRINKNKELINGANPNQQPPVNPSNDAPNSDNNKYLKQLEKQISFLENQLEKAQKEKSEQSDVIKNFQRLLENQQILALKSNEKIKELEMIINEKEGKNNVAGSNSVQHTDNSISNNKVDNFYKDLREDKQSNKGFLSRLFGGKK